MLVYEPSSRISAQDALKHEYFAVRRTTAPPPVCHWLVLSLSLVGATSSDR